MFNDRFTRDNQALADYIDNTTNPEDSELENLSPRLATYAKEVRRYSVILDQKSTWDIYQTATVHSDPHIALVLASADDKLGNPLFPSEEAVKETLYGVDIPNKIGNNELLADGVRRVSVSLTASILVGQLSQIPEQFQHSNSIKKQALEDLDRIIEIPESLKKSDSTEEELKTANTSFYFDPKNISLEEDDTLTCQVYIPSISTEATQWETVGIYEDQVSTATIVSDLADTVNQLTLVNRSLNLLSSPVLSGPSNTHFIEFYPREKLEGIQSEVVSIKFEYWDNSEGKTLSILPFSWGVDSKNLNSHPLNSTIILSASQSETVKASDVDSDQAERQTTLYFRSNPNETVQDHKIRFQVSPTDEEFREVDISHETDPKKRPGAAAFAISRSLSKHQDDTRVLAPIIRNDDPSLDTPVSSFKLVSYSLTNPEVYIILDILEVPKDLSIALGSVSRPLTGFSSRPKSIRTKSVYDPDIVETQNRKLEGSLFNVASLPRSKTLDRIKDETKLVTGWSNDSIW